VIGHLIHGEKTNWIERIKRILEFGNTKAFEVFDRFSQYKESKGKSLLQCWKSLNNYEKKIYVG
jgi:hypothetical protein